jgi:hypothetical protein
MPGLVPGIHVFGSNKSWMPATSAGMTKEYFLDVALLSPRAGRRLG